MQVIMTCALCRVLKKDSALLIYTIFTLTFSAHPMNEWGTELAFPDATYDSQIKDITMSTGKCSE